MKYNIIDKHIKFERTKNWIKSILVNQEDSVNRMLDVIKSDGQNKLSTLRLPKLEEWKKIYISMGWEYIEDRRVCICPTPYSFKDSPILQNDATFNNNEKEHLIYPNSHYDEVVGNYETYFFCQQKVRHTQLILRDLESGYFNDQLLDYEYIKHDEALCLLLGINANLPNKLTLGNEKLLSVYDYEADVYDSSINGLLFHSHEHQLLKRKFGTPNINTKDFIDWALRNEYIKEDKSLFRDVDNSPYGEGFAKSLYEELSTIGLISRSFEQLWKWRAHWNVLHYLAKQLYLKGLVQSKNYFKDIQSYIEYTGSTSLRQQIQPEAYDKTNKKVTSPNDKKVDTVISNLLENKQ